MIANAKVSAGVPKTRAYDLPVTMTPPPETGWHSTRMATLREAEDLLDALEANGFEERELLILAESNFAVRWR